MQKKTPLQATREDSIKTTSVSSLL